MSCVFNVNYLCRPVLEKKRSIDELVLRTMDVTSSSPFRPPLKQTPSIGTSTPTKPVSRYHRSPSETQMKSPENVVATLRTLLQAARLIDGAPRNGDATWAVTEPIIKHYLTQDTRHLADYLSLVGSLPHLIVRVAILVNTRLDIRRDADPYTSYTPLGHAIINNDPELVGTLLKYAADPDVTPCIPVGDEATDIESPVHLALRQHCKPEIVNELLRYGQRAPQMDDDYKRSVMSYVARCCDTDAVKALLDRMTDVDGTDENSRTMLHRAALLGNLIVVKDLTARKADVNKTDQSLKTPLICAAEVNAEDIVKFLVANGADVNKTDVFGRSALHFAVRKSTLAAVECLLDAGADATTKDNKDMTPLHYAYVDSRILERTHPREEEADLLECIINAYTAGQTYCTDQEFVDIAEILIKLSESSDTITKLMKDNVSHISARNDSGTTVLHYAAHFNKPEIVLWLIQHGADVKVANNAGWRAIHFAAMSGNVTSATEILKKYVAAVNIETREGWTPVWIALRNGQQEMAEFFIKKGCDVSRTMKVSDLVHFESGYSLPLDLYDPVESGKNKVAYARQLRRSITLADLAKSIGFRETASMILDIASGGTRFLEPAGCGH